MNKQWLGAIVVAMLISNSATSQEALVPVSPDVPDFVGVAVGVVNDHPGSDEIQAGGGPAARLSWGKRYVFLQGNNLLCNILDHEYLRLGPQLTYRFGRNDVEDEIVDRLEEVDDSFELGGFIGFELLNDVNPRIRLAGDLSATQDISYGHGGLLAQASIRYWHLVIIIFDFGLGIGARYATSDYMDSFYGVSAAESARSGLAEYDAEGDVQDVFVTAMLVMHFSRAWHAGIGIRYGRLLCDAPPIARL